MKSLIGEEEPEVAATIVEEKVQHFPSTCHETQSIISKSIRNKRNISAAYNLQVQPVDVQQAQFASFEAVKFNTK